MYHLKGRWVLTIFDFLMNFVVKYFELKGICVRKVNVRVE
jgi:hypothetical protein